VLAHKPKTKEQACEVNGRADAGNFFAGRLGGRVEWLSRTNQDWACGSNLSIVIGLGYLNANHRCGLQRDITKREQTAPRNTLPTLLPQQRKSDPAKEGQ